MVSALDQENENTLHITHEVMQALKIQYKLNHTGSNVQPRVDHKLLHKTINDTWAAGK